MRVRFLLSVAVLAGILSGCSGRETFPMPESVTEQSASSVAASVPSAAAATSSESMGEARSSEVSEEGTAPSPGLQTFVAQHFPIWVRAWKDAAPSFDLSLFMRGQDQRLMEPLEHAVGEADVGSLYLKQSPDGRLLGGATGGISEYFDDEDEKVVFFDLDSFVIIRDPATGMDRQLDATDACCSLTDGAWLDAETLVVVADAEYPEPQDGPSACPDDDICNEARIYVYHLSSETKETYRGAVVTSDARDTLLQRYWQERFPGFEIL